MTQAQVAVLLRAAGYASVEWYGDWDRSSCGADSREIIAVAAETLPVDAETRVALPAKASGPISAAAVVSRIGALRQTGKLFQLGHRNKEKALPF